MSTYTAISQKARCYAARHPEVANFYLSLAGITDDLESGRASSEGLAKDVFGLYMAIRGIPEFAAETQELLAKHGARIGATGAEVSGTVIFRTPQPWVVTGAGWA